MRSLSSLVSNYHSAIGIHPELIHLDEELSKEEGQTLSIGLSPAHILSESYYETETRRRKRGLELVESDVIRKRSRS